MMEIISRQYTYFLVYKSQVWEQVMNMSMIMAKEDCFCV